MVMRPTFRRAWRTLLRTITGTIGVCVITAALADAEGLGSPDRVMNVALRMSAEIPEAAQREMRTEVDRIWRHAGTRVNWLNGSKGLADDPAHVLIEIERQTGRWKARPGQAYPIAALQRSSGRIRVSLNGALSVLHQGLGERGMVAGPDRLRHLALGLVLGRAIAHEIGHVLLGPGHSDSGLMRPAFDAHEFLDRRTDAFSLNTTDTNRLTDQRQRHRLASDPSNRLCPGHLDESADR